jgi:hypothetical protein
MADRSVTLHELRSILRRYGVAEDRAMGKGSHTTFLKRIEGSIVTYPVPTTRKDVLVCYVRGCRKKFRLRPHDGVSDKEFYGKG